MQALSPLILVTFLVTYKDMVLSDSTESQDLAHLKEPLCEEHDVKANSPLQEPVWPHTPTGTQVTFPMMSM